MAAIRSSGTSLEGRLGALLRELFPRRRVLQQPRDLPGKPDYFLPGMKLAVFADGCFWHNCRKHGRLPEDNSTYWTPKLTRNRARDREVNKRLRAEGIQPVRVWEHELANGMSAARRKLRRATFVAP